MMEGWGKTGKLKIGIQLLKMGVKLMKEMSEIDF
jgi:hypothetical protein